MRYKYVTNRADFTRYQKTYVKQQKTARMPKNQRPSGFSFLPSYVAEHPSCRSKKHRKINEKRSFLLQTRY